MNRTTARSIIKEVAHKHDITVADLRGGRLFRHLTHARAEAAYRLRLETDLSLPGIASLLGLKTHGAVLDAVRRVSEVIDMGEKWLPISATPEPKQPQLKEMPLASTKDSCRLVYSNGRYELRVEVAA